MSITTTTDLGLSRGYATGDPLPSGEATKYADTLEALTAGYAEVSISSSNVTLTADQYACPLLVLIGALTANRALIFPDKRRRWRIINLTSGAYLVTARTAAGTGVVVHSGAQVEVYGDGTDLYFAEADAIRTLGTNTTLDTGDRWIFGDTAGGSVTLTLPAASAAKHPIWVKKTAAANTLTVQRAGSDTIDGATSKAWTAQYEAYFFVPNGAGLWGVG